MGLAGPGTLAARRAGTGGHRTGPVRPGIPVRGEIATVRAARRGQPVTAGRAMRPGHPRRQAVLLPGHGAAGRDHCGIDPGKSRPARGPLGGTRNVIPPSHRWERLNRTALGHLGPGSPCLPTWAKRAIRDASDHGRLTSCRSGVSCCGARHGDDTGPGAQGPGRARRPVDNGEPSSLPTGRTPVRRDGRALFRGGTCCGVRRRVIAHVALQPPLLAGGVPCDLHAEVPGADPGMRKGRST